MTNNFFIITLITVFILGCGNERESINKAPDTKPNIIFILADDYGIMDSQGYARKFLGIDTSKTYYETPNIDKLISEGLSFSQAYANQLCSPTRASILTGKYASRLGFTTAMPLRKTYYNQGLKVPEGYYAHDVLEHSDNIEIEQALVNSTSNSAIPSGTPWDEGQDELSLAEALQDYHSAFIGKWHLGGFGATGYQPKDHGFEPIAWYDAGGSPYFNWRADWDNTSKERFPDMPQQAWEIGNSGTNTGLPYLTSDLTEQALQFIDQHIERSDKPFFLHFSHFAVHTPYQAPTTTTNYFENKVSKGWNGHHDPTYAAMVKHLDYSVGQLLDKLKKKGIEDNTIVVFMSDNGGIDSKITPRGNGTDNSPFLGGKACLTEGGIRVPLIFRWKNKIPANTWVNKPVDCTDIFPTLLDLAGYDTNRIVSEQMLDGQSITSLIFNDGGSEEYRKNTHFWHYPFNVIYNNPADGYPLTPHSAVREGNYKLIFDWHGRLSLYDIDQDPYEENNLANTQPEISNQLFGKLLDWLEENVDKRYWPKPNTRYNANLEVRDQVYVDLIRLYKEEGRVVQPTDL
jgi:arylsulfatase A-like enzyme